MHRHRGNPPQIYITMFKLSNYRLSQKGTYLWHPATFEINSDDEVIETSPQPIEIAGNEELHKRWLELTKEA